MSSISLEPFQNRHPREREAIARLADLLRSEDGLLTLDQIAVRVTPRSRDELAVILAELAAVGLIGFEFQVRSPKTNEPLDAFPSLDLVPKSIFDESVNRTVEIRPEHIRPVYHVGLAAQ